MPRNPVPSFAIGLFFGVLIGAFLVFLIVDEDTAEPIDDRPRAQKPHPHDTPPPRAGGGNADPHGGGEQDMERQVAPYHFMKHFLDALSAKPTAQFPSPDWKPLLKDSAEPITLGAFSGNTSLDFDRMLAQYPMPETLDAIRHMKQRQMIPMMRAFVGRLNQLFADRLVKPVACTDCHLLDPSDTAAQQRVFPPLMVRFVKALKEKPKNRNPANGWKPLLKDPETPAMLCATCHKTTGAVMEKNLGEWDLSRPPEADNKEFMIHLMEAWVERLNRNARGLLRKAVVCIDCHETDPRR